MGATNSKHLTVYLFIFFLFIYFFCHGDTFLIGPKTIDAHPPGGGEFYGAV